jgi:hypothetical protein
MQPSISFLAAASRLGQRHQVDLDIPRHQPETVRGVSRHDRERALAGTEVAVPYVEEMRRVVEVPQVDLRLHRAGEGCAGRLQSRPELLAHEVLRLAPDLVAAPQAVAAARGPVGPGRRSQRVPSVRR